LANSQHHRWKFIRGIVISVGAPEMRSMVAAPILDVSNRPACGFCFPYSLFIVAFVN